MSNITVGSLVGPYRVTQAPRDGEGGMAQFCVAQLAESPDASKPQVALKISKIPSGDGREGIEEMYHDALNNEVEILRALRHPNIVHLYPIHLQSQKAQYIARAANVQGRPWFFVMEYLAGESLAYILDRAQGSRLPLKTAVEVVYQVALGLEYIHLKNISHLDLKPDNILFRRPLVADTKPDLALIDFGISRREKQTGLKAGAVAYMAPERIMLVRGELMGTITDQRPADVYSIGVILYRCIAGKSPLGRRDKSTTTAVILKEEPIPLSQHVRGVPPVIEDVITRCLRKEPSQRPTISEVLAALDEAAPPPRWSNLTAVPSNGSTQQPKSRLPQFVAGLTGMAVVGILIGFLTAMMVLPSSSPTKTPTPIAIASSTIAPAAIATQVVIAPTVTPPAGTAKPTVTPFATFTPAPTVMPYAPSAPVLLGPIGDVYPAPAMLTWSFKDALPEDAWFVMTLQRTVDGKTIDFSPVVTKGLSAPMLSNYLAIDGSISSGVAMYKWTVSIKIKTGMDILTGNPLWSPDFNISSQPGTFTLRAPTPTPTSTNTPILSTATPSRKPPPDTPAGRP